MECGVVWCGVGAEFYPAGHDPRAPAQGRPRMMMARSDGQRARGSSPFRPAWAGWAGWADWAGWAGFVRTGSTPTDVGAR